MFVTSGLPDHGARVTAHPMKTPGRFCVDIEVKNGFFTLLDVTEEGLAGLAAELTNAVAGAVKAAEELWREPQPIVIANLPVDLNMSETEWAKEQAEYMAGVG